MNLTVEQILALAPDASSAASGKSLARPGSWKSCGRTDAAVWGECQGSALYQVRVEFAAMAYKCSCPSRKLPCKHVIGLLLLAVQTQAAVSPGDAPEWVTSWLASRAERAQKAEAKKSADDARPVDPAAQAKRAAQREQRVAGGLDRFDLWAADVMRSGLAGLERQPPSYWDEQTRRLIDAQAPGLASRVRRLGELVGSRPDWPCRTLEELGRMALLTHAFRRIDQLSPGLQADVRQLVGWSLRQDEVDSAGERITDEWWVLGQVVETEDRVTVQRNWLQGAHSARLALVLQFSAAGQPVPESIVPGTGQTIELAFWPGAVPLRARVAARTGPILRWPHPLPVAAHDCRSLLDSFASALAAQPWLERWAGILAGVQILPNPSGPWRVRDGAGSVLPLAGVAHWKLLALSGGKPVDLTAEWDGERLWPLALTSEHEFYPLAGVE